MTFNFRFLNILLIFIIGLFLTSILKLRHDVVVIVQIAALLSIFLLRPEKKVKIIGKHLKSFSVVLTSFISIYLMAYSFRELSYIFYVSVLMLIASNIIKDRYLLLLLLSGLLLHYEKGNYPNLGIWISETDWSIIADVAIFIPIAMTILKIPNYIPNRFQIKPYKNKYEILPIFCIIAIHMANYFFAGIAKINLENNLDWIFNYTPNILYSSIILEQNPLLQGIKISESEILGLPLIVIIIVNIFVISTQLLSPLFLARSKHIFIALFLFDIFHIGVLLSSGIFFYKWIFLNLLLMWLVTRVEIRNLIDSVSKKMNLVLGAIIIISAFKLTYIPLLGWFDSNTVIRNKVYVKNGDELIYLPPNAFLKYSVAFAQHRVSKYSYPIGAYGAVRNPQYKKISCDNLDKVYNQITENKVKLKEFFIELKKYLEYSYRFDVSYDLFPHHIWSNLTFNTFSKDKLMNSDAVVIKSELHCFNKKIHIIKDLKKEKYDW